MTDPITRQLAQASFRGVPFSVRVETSPQNGRRIVLHEYLNSSERFVEDLGQIPPTFEIDAFVHGVEGFKTNGVALERALNQEGVGRLVMPVFGAFDAYAMAYSKRANQTSVGEIVYRLAFAIGRPAAGPAIAAPTQQQVYDFGDSARQMAETSFAERFEVPLDGVNAQSAQDLALGAVDQILETYSTSLPGATLTQVVNKTNEIRRNIARLVSLPDQLASRLIAGVRADPGLWQLISLGMSEGGSGFQQSIPLTSYANNYSPAVEITQARIQRNRNASILEQSMQVNALILSYETGANEDYSTTDEVDSARGQLEDAYERISLVETQDENALQSDPNTRTDIENVRLSSLAVIGDKRQETFRVGTLDRAAPSPSFVEAYNLYAEEFQDASALQTRTLELRRLNPTLPANRLQGDVNVFREA